MNESVEERTFASAIRADDNLTPTGTPIGLAKI
jgi:hypothetical protein